ncbi:MAG TPA: hypothetical protein VI030_07130 [Propionibacteriaceae bacterium]
MTMNDEERLRRRGKGQAKILDVRSDFEDGKITEKNATTSSGRY